MRLYESSDVRSADALDGGRKDDVRRQDAWRTGEGQETIKEGRVRMKQASMTPLHYKFPYLVRMSLSNSHWPYPMSHVASSQHSGYIFNQNNVFVFTTLSDSCCYIIYYILPYKNDNLQALVIVGSRDSRAGRTGLAGSRSAENYGISV